MSTSDERKSNTVRVRADPAWQAWVEKAAAEKQISVSSYVRMVVTDRMRQDGVEPPRTKKPRA